MANIVHPNFFIDKHVEDLYTENFAIIYEEIRSGLKCSDEEEHEVVMDRIYVRKEETKLALKHKLKYKIGRWKKSGTTEINIRKMLRKHATEKSLGHWLLRCRTEDFCKLDHKVPSEVNKENEPTKENDEESMFGGYCWRQP